MKMEQKAIERELQRNAMCIEECKEALAIVNKELNEYFVIQLELESKLAEIIKSKKTEVMHVPGTNKVKMGELAEDIFKQYLDTTKIGYYETNKNKEHEKAHPFDLLLHRRTDWVWSLSMCDVKCKPSLELYNGTGIDTLFMDHYRKLEKEHQMEFFVYFVDPKLEKCYGNSLTNLCKEVVEGNITYPFQLEGKNGEWMTIFHMDNMKDLFELTPEQAEELRSLDSSTYMPKEVAQKKGAERFKEIKKNALQTQK